VNGVVEPGETVDLSIQLSNSGTMNATGINGILTTSDPNTIISQNESNYPEIPSGGTGSSAVNYTFIASTNGFSQISFQLNMTSSEPQGNFTENFTLIINSAKLERGNRIVAVDGTETFTFDVGDEGEMILYVYNSGSITAKNITAELSTELDPDVVSIGISTQNYGDISGLTSVSNVNPFTFTVGPEYDGETDLIFKLTLTDIFGKTDDFVFDITETFPDQIGGYDFSAKKSYILLKWDPVVNIQGYNIYRSNSYLGAFERINDFVLPATSMYYDDDVNELTKYWYKISTVSNTGNELNLNGLEAHWAWTSLDYHDNFPITIPDGVNFLSYNTSVTIEDIDNNGSKELFPAYTYLNLIMGFDETGMELFDIDESGYSVSGFAEIILPEYNGVSIGGKLVSPASVSDVNNDGQSELFLTSYRDYPVEDRGYLFGFKTVDNEVPDNQPDPLWDPIDLGHQSTTSPVLADINNDGYLEIITNQEKQKISVFDYSGNLLWIEQIDDITESYGYLAVADLNNNGYKEIVFGTRDPNGAIYIFDHEGNPYSTNPVYSSSTHRFDSNPVIANIDSDPEKEIIICGRNGLNGKIYAFNTDGSFVSGLWDGQLNITFHTDDASLTPQPAVGDLNQDGILEIVVADKEKVYVFDNLGYDFAGFPIEIIDLNFERQSPILADIDPDDNIEILILASDKNIYAFNSDGSECIGWRLKSDNSYGLIATPTISDIDNDGFNEVVICNKHFTTFVWETTGDANKVEWGSYRSNAQNTGEYSGGCMFSDLQTLEIEEENMVWNSDKHIQGNLIIKSNYDLTIRSKVTFVNASKVIIEPGAILTIDGGKLTNACGGMWQGIEVQGTYNQPQDYAYQGNVKIINGGIIENAVCGIQTIKFNESTGAPEYNYTGGMVWADGGIFKNCRVAAKFWPYNHSLGSSFFRDCQFITNDDLLPGTGPDVFIKTTNLSRLTVIGSSFTDSRSGLTAEELTSGIVASDTYLRVYPYWQQKCVFTGLYNGIRVYAHNPDKTVLLKDNLFTDNFHSVYLSTVMEPTVIGNEFIPWDGSTGDPDNSYCLYIDYCTGYTIEENIFSYAGIHPKGIGLVINNSGSNNNEIYNNEFINLEFATLAQNNNRGENYWEGLVIKCNDYDDNSSDIAVTANELVAYPGIAKHQGAEGSTEMQAGNLFSRNDNGIDYSDFSTFKESPITYFHHDPSLSIEPRVEPEYYTDKYIYLDKQNTIFIKEESCESHLSGGGGGGIGRDDLTSNMVSSGLNADSTQTLLTALVDGGNTEILQQEVLQTMPQEAYDLYMSLMGKSPYLSDSVLIATIEKEYILPNVLIKDILAANPQSAKSPEVMDKVDEKAIPMTEEQIAEILLGKYIVAAKEKLESQLAYYKHQRSISLKFLKQSYRNDTVDPSAHDSLVLLLETENGLQEKFELVFAYSAQNNWTGAMALLNNLPNQYSFTQHEQEMYIDYNTFINVLYELDQAGTGLEALTAAQNTTLLQLADNTQNFAGAYARNILIGTDNYPYTEPIILLGDGLKSGSITFDLPVPKDYKPEYVKIYPNPAMNYIVVELNKTNISGAILTLYNNSGIVIRIVNIPEHVQNYVVGLKDIKPGIYILKADMDGKTVSSKKFSIIK
jgi:hypothetical protein